MEPRLDQLELATVLREEHAHLRDEARPAGADSLTAAIEQRHARPLAALCLSGGGIRSATFGLGVLQGLAHHGLLGRFDYLSTVSGGGFIGGWLSAWIHRHPRGLEGVLAELPVVGGPPLAVEPAPVTRLRQYSNYLTPKTGFMSPDTWTGIATYLRNLLLNWLVFVPILAAVLAIPRVLATVLAASPLGGTPVLSPADRTLLAVLGVLSSALIVCAIAYMGFYRPSFRRLRVIADEPLAGADAQRDFLLWCLSPLLAGALLSVVAWSWLNHDGCGAVALRDLLPRSGVTPGSCRVAGLDTGALLGAFTLGSVVVHVVAWASYVLLLAADRRGARPWEFGQVIVSGAMAGALTWLAAVKVSAAWPVAQYSGAYAVLGLPVAVSIFLLSETFYVGLMSRRMEDEDREWAARFGGWCLIVIVGWLAMSALVIFGPVWLQRAVVALGGLSGLVTLVLGWSGQTPASTSGSASPAARKTTIPGWVLSHVATVVAPLFAAFLVAILSWATSSLLAAIVTLSATDHLTIMRETTWQPPLVAGALFLIGYGMARWINANKFSLNALYRNRLIRAYLGASRKVRRPNRFTGFDPNDNVTMSELARELRVEITEVAADKLDEAGPAGAAARRELLAQLSRQTRAALSGQAPWTKANQARLIDELNVTLFADRPIFSPSTLQTLGLGRGLEIVGEALVRLNRLALSRAFPAALSAPDPETRQRPLQVVSMALNLVGGGDLAWQERKARSFTVSALHAGAVGLGYRDARYYGKTASESEPPGISLGTALSISGAAASPNQGYHSSPFVTFLMALFNVRLGWWLGNPGPAGDTPVQWIGARSRGRGDDGPRAFQLSYPDNLVLPLIQEALGQTDDRNPYVYLSDGGHFDNLGLYEMVLRRCHWIVVSDAGCDPTCALEDLGGAIRKIRIDLGISIDFADFEIIARQPKPSGVYCAVGTIRYAEVDGADAPDGTLLYLKPSIVGGEPKDVFNYAAAHETFPHESTADQWFSESQFESYRALGHHAITAVYDAGELTLPGSHDGDLDALMACARRYLDVKRPVRAGAAP